MRNYGIPYMGSKSGIAKQVAAIFPPAENFYDLFGGGFAITHAMIKHRSRSFNQFHFNEIRPGICNLVKDCIAGKYSYDNFEPAWVSREDFSAKKETDPYIKLCWSFGNNGQNYMFGKDIEQTKKSLHNAIVFNEFDDYAKKILGLNRFSDEYQMKDRRLFLKNRLKVLKNKRCDMEQLQQLLQLERLQQLQQLEQLERLQQLEQLEQLELLFFYEGDYRAVPILNNSIVYCDIPYFGTGEYDKNKNFNHSEFYEWARSLKHPLFVSEYSFPVKEFCEVWRIDKRSMIAGGTGGNIRRVEKVFCNKMAWQILRERNAKKSVFAPKGKTH